MKSYDYMLTLLLIRQYMSRDALESLFRTNINFAKHLANAKEKKHIETYKAKGADSEGLTLWDQNEKYRRTTLVYSLTREGLKYLIQSNANLLVSKISLEDAETAAVTPTLTSKKNFIETAIKTNDAATLATIAGAAPLVLNYAGHYILKREKELKRKSYDELVRDALESMTDEEAKKFSDDMVSTELSMFSSSPYDNCIKQNKFVNFIASFDAKQIAINNHDRERATARKREFGQSATRDFSRSGISGIIQGSFKSILTYTVLRQGMSWLKYYVKIDETIQYLADALTVTSETLKHKYDSNPCGALIVRSAHHFGMLYRDDSEVRNKSQTPAEKRKKKKPAKHKIGDYYKKIKRLYVLPMNSVGANFLKGDLLNRDDDEVYRKFKEFFLGQNNIQNEIIYTEVPGLTPGEEAPFPIRAVRDTGEHTYLAYGCMLDIKKIQSWDAIVNMFDEGEEIFTLVCYDWQVEYYLEVFGTKVRYMRVPENWID